MLRVVMPLGPPIVQDALYPPFEYGNWDEPAGNSIRKMLGELYGNSEFPFMPQGPSRVPRVGGPTQQDLQAQYERKVTSMMRGLRNSARSQQTALEYLKRNGSHFDSPYFAKDGISRADAIRKQQAEIDATLSQLRSMTPGVQPR